jgi:transcriptional regulator with XRE-family HTH domain
MSGDETRESDLVHMRGIGWRVRMVRRARELSQDELATAAGISRNFVSSIERGAHGVDVVRLYRVADALQVDIAHLVSPAVWEASPPDSLRSSPAAAGP